MHLTSLHLTDVRNYEQLDVHFSRGPTLLIGPNAQGKTNVVEAVHYLTIGRSFRTSLEAAMIREGTDAGVIRACALNDHQQPLEVATELRRTGRNRLLVNGQTINKRADGLGRVRSVIVAPENLRIIRGDPSERRRFLDDLLGGRRVTYTGLKADYDRALAQRNALLKAAKGGSALDEGSFEVWNDAFIGLASRLMSARIAGVHALSAPLISAYVDLVADSPGMDPTREPQLAYQLSTGRLVAGDSAQGIPDPQHLAEELRMGLQERHDDERRRGMTLAGPHRDDLAISIGSLPAKGYASHGEQWSLVLSLKLSAHSVIAETGDQPIMLLDDVFAELDDRRRGRLAELCSGFDQVIVTSPTGTDVPLAGTRLSVLAANITPMYPGSSL